MDTMDKDQIRRGGNSMIPNENSEYKNAAKDVSPIS